MTEQADLMSDLLAAGGRYFPDGVGRDQNKDIKESVYWTQRGLGGLQIIADVAPRLLDRQVLPVRHHVGQSNFKSKLRVCHRCVYSLLHCLQVAKINEG